MQKAYLIAVSCLISALLAGITSGQIHLSGSLSGVLEAGEYIVDDHIQVDSTDTLIIEAGAALRFAGHYKFNIYGLLQALGTETDSIIFTRLYPTEESKWWGLRFYANASDSCKLEYCVIEWGKGVGSGSDNHGGGIYCEEADILISDCAIRCCLSGSGGGIELNNC